MFDTIMSGLAHLGTISYWGAIIAGVLIAAFIGLMPGVGTPLGMAIAIAEQRVSGLQALDKALNGTSFLNSALSTVGATGHTELRGVLVNLFA